MEDLHERSGKETVYREAFDDELPNRWDLLTGVDQVPLLVGIITLLLLLLLLVDLVFIDHCDLNVRLS